MSLKNIYNIYVYHFYILNPNLDEKSYYSYNFENSTLYETCTCSKLY